MKDEEMKDEERKDEERKDEARKDEEVGDEGGMGNEVPTKEGVLGELRSPTSI